MQTKPSGTEVLGAWVVVFTLQVDRASAIRVGGVVGVNALRAHADVLRTGVAVAAMVVGGAAEVVLGYVGARPLFASVQGALHAVITLAVFGAAALDEVKLAFRIFGA